MTTTDRLALPLLAAGQAQKEVTHNEALALVDLMLMPVVQSVAPAGVPAAPALGQCWIVGSSASGAWSGQDGALAGWTAGGWRFAAPFDGMAVWSLADGMSAQHVGGLWRIGSANVSQLSISGIKVVGAQQAAIAAPSSGVVIDAEARVAISALLTALRAHGLIAS